MQLRHSCIIVKNIVPLLKKYVLSNFRIYFVMKQIISLKINSQWVGFNTYCGRRNKKLVSGKNQG